MKRHHKHRHHRDRTTSCYSNDSSRKSSATLWLLTTCPLVIAASSNNNLQRHLNNNYCTFNDRKRVRIRQQQELRRRLGMAEFILQLRGGDDNNIMNNSHLTHHQHTASHSQQTIIHPIATSHGDSNDNNDINENMNHSFDSIHNSYSAENEISSNNNNYNVNNVVNTSSISGKVTNRLKDLQRGSLSSPPPPQQQEVFNESNQSTLPSENYQQNYHQQQQQKKGPRLVIEFDTQAINNSNKSLRSRIRSRIGNNENDWDRLTRQRQHGAGLSISVDLSPSASGQSGSSFDYGGDRSLILAPSTPSVYNIDTTKDHDNNNNATDLTKATITTLLTTYTILKQSALLLPPLLLTRRALNSTRDAVVDYFRGRIFRTTFTRMERAYLRYYEFPAVIRAASRLASQIGILLVLSVTVRYWMFVILAGDVVGPLVLGMSGMDIRHDIGMVGTSSSGGASGGGESLGGGGGVGGSILGLRNVGLPCYQRGRGMAWLCSLIWIGAVVGTGHACTVAVSFYLTGLLHFLFHELIIDISLALGLGWTSSTTGGGRSSREAQTAHLACYSSPN